jgi:hypothetical protein
MRNLSLSVAMSLLFGAAAIAQTPVRLIGNTMAGPSQLITQDLSTCQIKNCNTGLAGITNKASGGTAYDATQGIVWVSTGPTIEAIEPDTCKVHCAPHVPAGLAAGEEISGLACNERTAMLIATTTQNNIIIWKLSCPLTSVVIKCNVTPALPTGHTLSGVASDDLRNEIIYASGDFVLGTGGGMFFVAPLTAPCVPVCKFGIRVCQTNLMNVVTGVAYDPCKQIIWCTDGNYASGVAYNRTQCTVIPQLCCKLPINNLRYCGLCVRPSHATPSGNNCTTPPNCPNCPSLAHTTIGDPIVGNSSFGLALQNAPSGGIAWLFLNGGPCTPPGIGMPFLCAGLQVPIVPAPWVLGGFPLAGTPPCGGNHTVFFSIPPIPVLCGATLSSQYIGLCKLGALPTFVTNCLTWTISGS